VAERVLTERELNRAVLARQLLLERSKLSLPRALEQVGGLQTQYAPTAYIGLWSRLQGFERDALTRALQRKSVVQGTLLRVTIHMVSRRDYWPFAIAVREGRRTWWLRFHKDLDSREMAAAAKKLHRKLDGGTVHRDDIVGLVGDAARANGAGLWLDLVRVPPSGTWERRRADLFAAAEDWIGRPDVEPGPALDHLVKRYLGGFGPARVAEIADWGGLALTPVKEALERLKLRTFRDEQDKELVDLPRAPLPPADTPAPPRFLGVWEAPLLVHARATQILPEEYRPLVFNTKTPHSVNTFLVDGSVAGTWRVERSTAAAELRLETFAPLPRGSKSELVEEAERLVRFVEPDAPKWTTRVARA
jgi:Winged helix DNA-binding domain